VAISPAMSIRLTPTSQGRQAPRSARRDCGPQMQKELSRRRRSSSRPRAEVDQAVASLAAAAANVDTAKALVLESQASVAARTPTWIAGNPEYHRFEKLVKRRSSISKSADESLNQYKSAKAMRDEIKAKVQSAEAMAKEATRNAPRRRPTWTQRRRASKLPWPGGPLRALVEYRFIRAPFKGVVTRRNIHTGFFLQPTPAAVGRLVYRGPHRQAAHRRGYSRRRGDVYHGRSQGQDPGADHEGLTFEGKIARNSGTLDAKSRTLRHRDRLRDRGTRKRQPGCAPACMRT